MIGEDAGAHLADEEVVELLEYLVNSEALFLECRPAQLGPMKGSPGEGQWLVLLLIQWQGELCLISLRDDGDPEPVRGVREDAGDFARILVLKRDSVAKALLKIGEALFVGWPPR